VTSLTYQVGVPAWEGGKTTLVVRADGAVHVDNERAGAARREYDGTVAPADVGALFTQAQALGLWTTARRATAVPDEAPVTLELSVGGVVAHRVDLWDNQLRQGPLAPIHARLDGIVRAVSGGEVY